MKKGGEKNFQTVFVLGQHKLISNKKFHLINGLGSCVKPISTKTQNNSQKFFFTYINFTEYISKILSPNIFSTNPTTSTNTPKNTPYKIFVIYTFVWMTQFFLKKKFTFTFSLTLILFYKLHQLLHQSQVNLHYL